MPYKVLGQHNNKQRANDFVLFDVAAGLNINADDQELADNELTIGTNVYIRTDGAVTGRLGVTRRFTGNSAPTLGLVRFYQTVVNGTGISPFKLFTLAQIGGQLIDVDRGGISYGSIGANGQPWNVVQVYDPNHSGGPSDVLIICTGSGGPYIFDGTTIYTPANWTTNIPGAKYVQLINGILWFSGVSGQPNLCYGSALLGPENIPYYNEINVSHTITGLGVLGSGPQAALAVGMDPGLALILGVGPQNFYVQEIPNQDSVSGYRTMITVDGILYYQGDTAMYRCDGYSNTPISDKIKPWIVNDPLHPEFPMNGNRQLSFTTYYQRRLYFWYDSGNVGHCNTALVYDLDRTGWTVYSGLAFMSGCSINAPNDVDPPVFITGNATTGIVYNFETAVSSSQPQAFWNVSDDGAPIFVQAQTKYFKLGQPGTPKTLLRAYPEIYGTVANPLFGVASNYGPATAFGNLTLTTSGTMTWASSPWGPPTTWSTEGDMFFSKRIDFNVQAESFAFSMTSNDTNPPWRWHGLSGTFSQLGKS